MSKVKSAWARKRANLHQMVKAFTFMPQVLAMSGHEELISEELNGNPINRITGNLANSFDVERIGQDSWALKQVTAQAPYAPRVMVTVSERRAGKPAMRLMTERMLPRWTAAVVGEFDKIASTIEGGGDYRWNPRTFENRI